MLDNLNYFVYCSYIPTLWKYQELALDVQKLLTELLSSGGYSLAFTNRKILADNNVDGLVKSQKSDDFVKSSQARRASPEERGVLFVRRNDEG